MHKHSIAKQQSSPGPTLATLCLCMCGHPVFVMPCCRSHMRTMLATVVCPVSYYSKLSFLNVKIVLYADVECNTILRSGPSHHPSISMALFGVAGMPGFPPGMLPPPGFPGAPPGMPGFPGQPMGGYPAPNLQPPAAAAAAPQHHQQQQPKSSWSEHSAPDGRKYYYNSDTRQSVWVKPEELMTPEVRDSQAGEKEAALQCIACLSLYACFLWHTSALRTRAPHTFETSDTSSPWDACLCQGTSLSLRCHCLRWCCISSEGQDWAWVAADYAERLQQCLVNGHGVAL